MQLESIQFDVGVAEQIGQNCQTTTEARTTNIARRAVTSKEPPVAALGRAGASVESCQRKRKNLVINEIQAHTKLRLCPQKMKE